MGYKPHEAQRRTDLGSSSKPRSGGPRNSKENRNVNEPPEASCY